MFWRIFEWFLDLLGATGEHKYHFDFTLSQHHTCQVKGGGHTGFQIIPCADGCGTATIMPAGNLQMCTDAAKDEFFRKLEEEGLTLEPGCLG